MSALNSTDPVELSCAELSSYSRQIAIPEITIRGQRRLKNSSVLIVGIGALGSSVALSLAAAGVGRLGLVDFDIVEASNLPRQLLYDMNSVGRAKVECGR